MTRSLPPALCPTPCLYTAAHGWLLALAPRSAAAKPKNKQPPLRRRELADSGLARAGAAGSQRGSDGPPAPGPLGTVVFVKKPASCFSFRGLPDPPKYAKRHSLHNGVYVSCYHQIRVHCPAKTSVKNIKTNLPCSYEH